MRFFFGGFCLVFGAWRLVLSVWCLVFAVWGSEFRIWGLVFGVWCLGFEVWCLVFGVLRCGGWGLEFVVCGLGFGVWCLVFGVLCLVFDVLGLWCLVFVVWGFGVGVWGGDTPAPCMCMKFSPRARAHSQVDMRLAVLKLTRDWLLLSGYYGSAVEPHPLFRSKAPGRTKPGEPNHPAESQGFEPAEIRLWLEPMHLLKQSLSQLHDAS